MQLLSVPQRLCRFMMHVFILPKGRYRPQHGHVANNDALCDWDGIGQQQLRFVHDHFLHYLDQC
jgi:hypothetical protein